MNEGKSDDGAGGEGITQMFTNYEQKDYNEDHYEDEVGVISVFKVTSMEKLPVRAVHFGDTGTPLDSKEGRWV